MRSNEATPLSSQATASPSMMQERERRRANVSTPAAGAYATALLRRCDTKWGAALVCRTAIGTHHCAPELPYVQNWLPLIIERGIEDWADAELVTSRKAAHTKISFFIVISPIPPPLSGRRCPPALALTRRGSPNRG